jgi:iron complex outermembrane receptor protein
MKIVGARKLALLVATALSAGLSAPAFAADADADADAETGGGDIVVNARRVEERLVDVPVSVSVLQPADIANNNIVSSADIANFTPNLSVNRRFGDEATSFVIRGFQQENGTAPTVGTYFGDVVALRGGGEASNGGDGAGPGMMYDLQNVQVLKGPQGTLFGRNSTGGAVLLVPTKPKSDFGGNLEASAGDYGMYRVQGAVNIPVGDTFRVRIAGDRMKRNGYLRNVGFPGSTGRQDFGDVDYYSVRLSAVAELSPDFENYTIATLSHSDTNGGIPSVKMCNPAITTGVFASLAAGSCAQIAREAAAGKGFWTVGNSTPNTGSLTKSWQIINTTTWQVSDSVQIKNLFSYGELKSRQDIEYFGNDVYLTAAPAGPQDVLSFIPNSAAQPYNLTINQSTLVEELRFSGNALDGKLDWQFGGYYEASRPLGTAGQQYGQLAPCSNVNTLTCNRAVPGVSSVVYNVYRSSFTDIAGYAQASYHVSSAFTVTAGVRYTDDKVTKSWSRNTYPATGASAFPNPATLVWAPTERTETHKPTWLISLEYKPAEDMLVYAKYARGYRQGNINATNPAGRRSYDAENVDAYEAGFKAQWGGSIPGHVNTAAFYNDFKNQQLQSRLVCNTNYVNFSTCNQTSVGTFNIGKSRMYGLEADLSIEPLPGLELGASYGYLNSKITAATLPPFTGTGVNDMFSGVDGYPPIGARLAYAPSHKLSVSGKYTFPLPESAGKVSIGGNIQYSSDYTTGYASLDAKTGALLPSRTIPSPVTGLLDLAVVPAYTYGNTNVNWEDVGGLPVDISFFVTNVTNKKMIVAPNDQLSRGFVSYFLAPPRMWGARINYRFGN